jgi:hypothetical protein
VAELSISLDTAFEQIEPEGELDKSMRASFLPKRMNLVPELTLLLELGDIKEQLRITLQRLDNEASMYSNSRLSEEEMETDWGW